MSLDWWLSLAKVWSGWSPRLTSWPPLLPASYWLQLLTYWPADDPIGREDGFPTPWDNPSQLLEPPSAMCHLCLCLL